MAKSAHQGPYRTRSRYVVGAVAVCCCLGVLSASAAVTGEADRSVYIVQLVEPPVASYGGDIPGLAATSPRARGEARLDAASAASRLYAGYLSERQSAVLAAAESRLGRPLATKFRYAHAFNGFAVELTAQEAVVVAATDGVRQVQREVIKQLHTDVGPQWIGADALWNGTATGGPPGTMGEGVLIGVIDTGLHLGHPSFADVGGDGYDHVNPLGAGTYLGLCSSDPGTYACNDKTIGYYIFTGETTEDTDGHGSNVASVAAGNYLYPGTVDLSPFNLYSPAIQGVASHANLIAYDACVDGGGCPLAALIAAINQATADGVDAINYSIGGGTSNPWTDSDSLAFLAAQEAGIVPVTSAGNSGPGASTVGSPGDAPWMVTVGAATHNRAGLNALVGLAGGDTPPPADLQGLGFSVAHGPAPIVYAGDFGDALCLSPFPASTWTNDEIVVCDRGTNARVAKGWNVLQGGAGGMVLANAASGQSLNGDVHHLPAVHVSQADGSALKTWIASGAGHMGAIAGTTLSFLPSNGDVMAGFSSRGPLVNPASDVVKPDLAAPGVDILGAYRDDPPSPEDPTRNYAVVSGTSQASPHTAGAAALLRALYPAWTVAEIRSALMTTAVRAGVRKEDGATPADPFDRGAGRVNLDEAARVGLLLDVPPGAFAAANPGLGGDPKSLNLATLGNLACPGNCSWVRTVRNPRATTESWTAALVAPPGMTGSVTPSAFTLAPGESQDLTVQVIVTGLPFGVPAFAEVLLEHGANPVAPAGDDIYPAQHLAVAVVPIDAPCVITPPANATVPNEAGVCGAVVSYPAPEWIGSCGAISCAPPSGSLFGVGTTTVTCGDGGTTATFDVTVLDVEAPAITCPADLTVAAPPGAASLAVFFPDPTATDNCASPPAVACAPASGDPFPIGTTTVSCVATDDAGLTAGCGFEVEVTERLIAEIPTLSALGLALLAALLGAGALIALRRSG